jgi:hypothetical protein
MTDKEINRATIVAFVARCINSGSTMALDAEFGLRVRSAEVTALGNIVIDFHEGVALVIAGMPVTREIANVN